MKKLISGIIVVGAIVILGLQMEVNAKQPSHNCWYNPQIQDCDTGGTIACISEGCK